MNPAIGIPQRSDTSMASPVSVNEWISRSTGVCESCDGKGVCVRERVAVQGLAGVGHAVALTQSKPTRRQADGKAV